MRSGNELSILEYKDYNVQRRKCNLTVGDIHKEYVWMDDYRENIISSLFMLDITSLILL